jgi:alpha(1,3/1,4) fucosyltransferase
MNIINKINLFQSQHRNQTIHVGNIYYTNFWTTQQAKDIWFTKFIEHHKLLNTKRRIYFYSVLGSVNNLKKRKEGINIFYSGENMEAERFSIYKKVCEQKPFDLSIGFEYRTDENYLRFPLWIITLFDPTLDYNGVKERVQQLSVNQPDGRSGFCSLVASHDWNGIRGQMINELSDIGFIASGGRYRNNTNDLSLRFNDNKKDFISQYKFNICPENSNAPGYVTEKIFQAIDAGCIPIYWGSDNHPEPEILNQEAIIFWKNEGTNIKTTETIKQLQNDYVFYADFIKQPRCIQGAEEIIWNYYLQLKIKIELLLK